MSITDIADAGLQGSCAPRFAAVQDALAENFASREEIGITDFGALS